MKNTQPDPSLREQLLDAGMKLLSEQGYHGTGIKEILEQVRVPKGSFYHYFTSKEAFTAEIISDYSERLLEGIEQHLTPETQSARETIRHLYRMMVTEFERRGCIRGCLFGNLAAEIGATNERCQEALQQGYQAWRERFVPVVEQGQRAGEFRDDVPAGALADMFWNHWEGGILRMKLEGQAKDLRQDLDWLLDWLMAPPSPVNNAE